MKLHALFFAGLLAVCSAGKHVDLTPPKQPLTPFFNLFVAYSPNTSLIGQWVTTPDYGSYLSITPNFTDRALFYQSANWTNREHPAGGSVLVHNVTDAVPYDQPGTPYTARNLIAGTGSALTLPDAGLPISASVFTKSQPDWDDFGSWELDFRIDPVGQQVHFQVVQGDPVPGWTKTSACWFNLYGFVTQRFVVLDHYPEQCSELKLIWVPAAL